MATCYCGGGCKGKESITDPRVRSERDAVAKYLALYGPLPVYAEGGDEPLYYIESLDDPRIGQDPPRQTRKSGGPTDPVRSARLQEAIAYIRDYRGTWSLILDLRADRRWGTKWFRLSDRQVEVILAAKKRDEERAAERQRSQTGRDLTVLPYGRTYAAVPNESGAVTFLIIDRPKPESRWHGWVFVKQQQGPNEMKLGAQRPGESYVGQWPGLIDKVLADPTEAVARYGRELGICGVCALPLTNEESREAGIGPVCRSRLAA